MATLNLLISVNQISQKASVFFPQGLIMLSSWIKMKDTAEAPEKEIEEDL